MSKKIYFASDFHLGTPSHKKSLEREHIIVGWMNHIQDSCEELYLMGDVFDFWFEYKKVVPKGFLRFFGKLAEFSDAGIPIHFFPGNHDMWVRDYLKEELNIIIHKEPISKTIGTKKFYLAHGDGLGPGDQGYKLLKKIFASPFCQWLYARLHPNFGMAIANYWSSKSRAAQGNAETFLGEDKEWLIQYSKEILRNEHFDYFVYGHRHLPITHKLNDTSTYINLGDWIRYYTYAEFENDQLTLKEWESKNA